MHFPFDSNIFGTIWHNFLVNFKFINLYENQNINEMCIQTIKKFKILKLFSKSPGTTCIDDMPTRYERHAVEIFLKFQLLINLCIGLTNTLLQRNFTMLRFAVLI